MGFKIEKSTIVFAAEREIAHIDKIHEEIIEKEISRKMNRRWFPIKTRDRALFSIEHSAYDAPWPYIHERDKYWLENILKACSITSGDYVELSIKEAAYIVSCIKRASER